MLLRDGAVKRAEARRFCREESTGENHFGLRLGDLR